MAEISETSRIFAVATAGIQLSIKLLAFADDDGAKPDPMCRLGHDIAITSGVLRQLGEFMTAKPDEKQAVVSQAGLHATMESATACSAIFDEVHGAFKALVDGKSLKPITGISTRPVYTMNMPFPWSRINLLWDDLMDLRLALMLQLQLTTLASCRRANECNTPAAAQQKEQEELIRSIVALQYQRSFPRKHMNDVTRRNTEIEDNCRPASGQDAKRHLGGKDGERFYDDRIAPEIRKDMDSLQEAGWRGSGQQEHTNPGSPKPIATDFSHGGRRNSSPDSRVDMPEIAEKSKKIQVGIKEIERQNSENSKLAQGELAQSSVKRGPTDSSNLCGTDLKTQPESTVPATGKPVEEVEHTREHCPRFIHRIWSLLPWSRSSSFRESGAKRGMLQLYFMEPYTSAILGGGLTIKWDKTLQAIDQRHISEELARDERSRRTSLVRQLAHLPECEGFEIQQWLKHLPRAAVLESVVRRTINTEHNAIKIKKIPSYRLIIRLLSNEEVEEVPAYRNFPYRRSIGSEVSIRDPGRPKVEDNVSDDQPQLILSKRDTPGGDPQSFPLDRPAFVKVHRRHLEPATLNAYKLPWVWDQRDSNYIIIRQWIPGCDQDILFEHTRQLRKRQGIRPTYIKVLREHLSPDTLDAYDLPWEVDQHDSRYLIIKRWIDEEFQDVLFDHTRRMRARQEIGHKQTSEATKPWNDPNRPYRLSDMPESEVSGDNIAEALLGKCQTLEAAKEALEAAVRKRDAAGVGAAAGKARGAGGEEKNESVDELLGRYTTLFNISSKTATATSPTTVDGNVVEGEVSKTEENS